MNNNGVYALGLMSGTSLDGLDIVYVKFNGEKYYDYEILATKTYEYSDEWKEKLKDSSNRQEKELQKMNLDYGVLIGEYVNLFREEYSVQKIDFLASHGHTVFHEPEKGITLQIGDGQVISNATQLKVVCDFRTQDVQLGGQGAPLVPIGDHLLFSDYDACLNLGGFANISYRNKDQERIAFDICPVNIVLNHFAQKLGESFDNRGRLSQKGELNKDLLYTLNQLSFYEQIGPKSLGIEWVKETIFPLIDKNSFSSSTVLRTFVEHASIQISNSILDFERVLFTGGGVYNEFLLQRISSRTRSKVIIPSKEIIEYKEALIFAFLGLLKLQGKTNCLASVTGAKKNHSSGVIFNPNNSL